MTLDPEIKDHYGTVREQSKVKRAKARETVPQQLDAHNIAYVSKNNGAHLIIASRWDLWPGTGKWRDRKTNKYSRGVDALIKKIKGCDV